MALSPNVGAAYVAIHADTSGLARELSRKIEQQLGAAGDRGGQQFNQRFLRRLQQLGNASERTLQSQGRRGGLSFMRGFDAGTQRGLQTTIRRMARQLGDAGGRGGRDAGRRASDAFGRGFSLDLGPINLQFASLTQAIIRLAPAAVLVGDALVGLSAQVLAIAGALGSAASASAAFVPLLGSLVTGIGVAVIGFQGFIDAVKEGEEAIAGLQPAAQDAARAVRSLGAYWQELQQTIQEQLFQDLGEDIRLLGANYFPILNQALEGTAFRLNEFFQQFLTASQATQNMRDLEVVLGSQNRILASLLGAIVPLMNAFRDFYVTVLPFAERLAEALQQGAINLAEMAARGRETGELQEFFERAYDNASNLLAGLRDLTAGLVAFFGVGEDYGSGMLETFAELMERFRAFAESAEGQESFHEFFQFGAEVAERLASVLRILYDLVSPLIPIVNGLFGALEPLLPIFEELAGIIGENLAIALQPLVPMLTTLVAALAEGLAPVLPQIGEALGIVAGAIATLFTALEPLMPVLAEIAVELLQAFADILLILAPYVDDLVLALLPLIAAVGEHLLPLLPELIQLFRDILPILEPLATFIVAVLVVALVLAAEAIDTVSGAVDTVIGWFEDLPGPIQVIIDIFTGDFAGAADNAAGLIDDISGAIDAVIGWFQSWENPIGVVASALSGNLSSALAGVGFDIDDLIGWIDDAIGWLDDIGGAFDAAGDAAGPFSGAIEGVISAIRGIAGAVRGALGWIRDLVDAINSIPSLPDMGGFDIPFIPGLAAGGIVRGETVRRVGEGGRAEAVVPLERPLELVDPSVRWMAELLRGEGPGLAAGGVAGGGTTIMPGAIQLVYAGQDPERAAESFLDQLVTSLP